MRKPQAGFTIIEVMVVVVIIGILAVVAIRSVREYTMRAKMSEAILALTNCRSLIAEVYLTADTLPSAGNWGCEVASNHSKYVDSISTTDEGVIKVGLHGFGDLAVDFHQITMEPLDNTNNVPSGPGVRVARWRCGRQYTPDGTDVPVDRLPSTCRGN
jgi:type IV pilus assembly protein PilA